MALNITLLTQSGAPLWKKGALLLSERSTAIYNLHATCNYRALPTFIYEMK